MNGRWIKLPQFQSYNGMTDMVLYKIMYNVVYGRIVLRCIE